MRTLTRDSLIQDLNSLEERVAEKIQAKDEEIRDLKTKNRDQKKEIEDIRAERDLYLKPGIQMLNRPNHQIGPCIPDESNTV